MAPKDKKSLKDVARDELKNNPSALGDPVSLKAEKSDTEPTDEDRPYKSSDGKDGKSLKDVASENLESQNPSMIGDPVSLKAETADSHPTDQDAGAGQVDASKLHMPKPKL